MACFEQMGMNGGVGAGVSVRGKGVSRRVVAYEDCVDWCSRRVICVPSVALWWCHTRA